MQRQGLKILQQFIIVLLSCTLLGCSTASLETVMDRYQKASVCCSGYSDFNYEKLVMPDSKVFWINEESKTFIFDTGKSHFKAFELPKYSAPYFISIRSYKIGQTADSFYIFSPAVMFLDERFNVTRFLSRNVFEYHTTSFFDFDAVGNTIALEGKVTVAAENADERYMVILTTNELLAEKTMEAHPSFVPFIFPGAVGVIPTGRMNTFIIPHSPSGKVKMLVSVGQ